LFQCNAMIDQPCMSKILIYPQRVILESRINWLIQGKNDIAVTCCKDKVYMLHRTCKLKSVATSLSLPTSLMLWCIFVVGDSWTWWTHTAQCNNIGAKLQMAHAEWQLLACLYTHGFRCQMVRGGFLLGHALMDVDNQFHSGSLNLISHNNPLMSFGSHEFGYIHPWATQLHHKFNVVSFCSYSLQQCEFKLFMLLAVSSDTNCCWKFKNCPLMF
jgi:hypothetical protein